MGKALDSLAQYGYMVVFGSVFAEQIGLPFPSEPFLLAAGGLVGSGRLALLPVLLLAGIASLIGDTAWYWLGRAGGPRVLGWLCRISLEPGSCVTRSKRFFGDYGARSLLIAKFVPGFSTIAPPMAGVIRMPFRDFFLGSALGGVVWAGAYVAVGWIFSSQLEQVLHVIDQLGVQALVLGGVALAAYIVWKFIARRRFIRKLRVMRITPEELKARLDGGEAMLVVDLRNRIDFEAEPEIIPGALHLTVDELEARHHEIPRERDIVLYCTCPTEATSARVAMALKRRGIERVRPLEGGYHAWRDRGYPLTGLRPALAGGSDDNV